jgi:hypothetical protein
MSFIGSGLFGLLMIKGFLMIFFQFKNIILFILKGFVNDRFVYSFLVNIIDFYAPGCFIILDTILHNFYRNIPYMIYMFHGKRRIILVFKRIQYDYV